MHRQWIVIGGLVFAMSVAIAGKSFCFSRMGRDGTYVFWTLIAFGAILTVVLGINRLTMKRHAGSRLKRSGSASVQGANRRRSFRVAYPPKARPVLMVDNMDDQPRRTLEYAVIDISEKGLSFLDDGSLGRGARIRGRIRFDSGEVKPIECHIVRKENRRVCVRLDNRIEWATLLREQRRLIGSIKSGPS